MLTIDFLLRYAPARQALARSAVPQTYATLGQRTPPIFRGGAIRETSRIRTSLQSSEIVLCGRVRKLKGQVRARSWDIEELRQPTHFGRSTIVGRTSLDEVQRIVVREPLVGTLSALWPFEIRSCLDFSLSVDQLRWRVRSHPACLRSKRQ
jgi:hypothetical protein